MWRFNRIKKTVSIGNRVVSVGFGLRLLRFSHRWYKFVRFGFVLLALIIRVFVATMMQLNAPLCDDLYVTTYKTYVDTLLLLMMMTMM